MEYDNYQSKQTILNQCINISYITPLGRVYCIITKQEDEVTCISQKGIINSMNDIILSR